jgi:hypothetical protein
MPLTFCIKQAAKLNIESKHHFRLLRKAQFLGSILVRSANAVSRLQLVNCAVGLLCSSSTFTSASFDVYDSGAIY